MRGAGVQALHQANSQESPQTPTRAQLPSLIPARVFLSLPFGSGQVSLLGIRGRLGFIEKSARSSGGVSWFWLPL